MKAGTVKNCAYLCLSLLIVSPTNAQTINELDLVLDGYAYPITSEVLIDLAQQTVSMETNAVNCTRSMGQLPLTDGYLTLLMNNQAIGLQDFKYFISSNLVFITSQSSDLVCDNGIYVDEIFFQGFE